MADERAPGDGPTDERPSLAMPPLSLGRNRRRSAPDGPPPEGPAEDQRGAEPQEPTQHLERGPERAAPVADPTVERPPRERRRPTLPGPPVLPGLTGVAAPLATGAVVGATGVLLVWLASMGCEAARGTASCGDGPGFWVLVAILVALAYLGTALLRAFGTTDAGSTSLLAVGVLAVLLLVLFSDSLFEWWMALAVPVVSAAAYALSWWLSTRAVEPAEDPPPDRL